MFMYFRLKIELMSCLCCGVFVLVSFVIRQNGSCWYDWVSMIWFRQFGQSGFCNQKLALSAIFINFIYEAFCFVSVRDDRYLYLSLDLYVPLFKLSSISLTLFFIVSYLFDLLSLKIFSTTFEVFAIFLPAFLCLGAGEAINTANIKKGIIKNIAVFRLDAIQSPIVLHILFAFSEGSQGLCYYYDVGIVYIEELRQRALLRLDINESFLITKLISNNVYNNKKVKSKIQMNQRLSQFSEIISNSSALKLLLIFVIINVGIVIMGFKQRVTSLQLHLFEITLNQRRLFPVFPIDINSNDYLNMHALPLKESLKMYESRRLLNQPKISEDYFHIWTIQSVKTKQLLKKQKQNCAIINSYNLVQQTTLLTAFQLLDSSTITKVLLLTRDRDQYSENLIGRISKQQYRVDNQRVSLDSDYQFIKHHTNQCKKIVYLQGNFQVSSQMAKNLDKQIKDFKNHSLIYSALGNVNGELKKFHPIPQINLENLLLEQIHQYLFVFDANLLNYITPLNFAYYAKYSFEQMIIWPMLAILQQTKLVHASDQVLHGFNFTSVSLPEFAVKPPVKQDNSICFISYPSDPDQISYTQIQSYLYSLEKMNKQKMKISIVMYVPYAYGHSTEIIKILQKLQKLQKGGLFERIRLRIRVNKTVSTLAAYESVYQYCPNQSLIVTSRHNIKFHEDFAMEILRSVTQKYHYIHTGFTVENQGDVIFMELPKYDGKYTVRRADWFEKYFMHFQVYKSDFLKTNLFWVLKNQELDFYETESPLVNLMMEETRLEFEYINKTLVTVGRRIQTELEKMQISHVKSYAEYSKLINNQLMPYKYNCLENPAYRRYAPELIQRNIHQIWITDQPVPKLRMVLHDSIKDKNPNFNVTLWKASDIKKQSFPVTYQIVQRTFEHHKDSDRSFFTLAADLLRYQLIYKYGGIYIDFKMEGKKALDNFLKYEIFYLDCDIQHIRLGNPQAIGIGVMGSMKNSYHMKKLLFEIIYEENIKFSLQIPQQTGGWNGRKSFTDEEFFTLLGLGYQLLFPLPYDDIVNACGGESKVFDSDQTVYEVIDVKSKKRIKIGLPCKQYPQAYLISYSPLAKTWLSTQQSQLEANRIVANQLNSHNN